MIKFVKGTSKTANTIFAKAVRKRSVFWMTKRRSPTTLPDVIGLTMQMILIV